MSNPLVSGPIETSSAFAGLGIIESGEALCLSVQSGSWVEGGIAAFSVAMDTIGMVIDPIGSLISMGLGWLLENLEPLKGWLNTVTGNADEVAGFAQTWTNIAAHLKTTGEDLLVSIRRVEGLSGATIDAYRSVNSDAAAHVAASGQWAEGIAAGMQIASMIVGMVHDITRDAISIVVGTAVSAAITTVATVGFGAPVAAAQVATKVAQLAGKVGKFITRLVRSLGNFSDLVKKLSNLFDGAGTGFRNAVPDAPNLPTVRFDPDRAPNINANIRTAVDGGAPTTLNRATREQKMENRAAALAGQGKPPAGMSLDEYPFASSTQGGAGSTVRPVPVAEQNYQGGILSSFYRDNNIKPGDPYRVEFE